LKTSIPLHVPGAENENYSRGKVILAKGQDPLLLSPFTFIRRMSRWRHVAGDYGKTLTGKNKSIF
jgi:hypothetical protein